MNIQFSTNCTATAKKYIDQTDCSALKENIKAVLEGVEQGMIRIGDPFMYGKGQIAIFPGNKWDKEKTQEDFANYVGGFAPQEPPDKTGRKEGKDES